VHAENLSLDVMALSGGEEGRYRNEQGSDHEEHENSERYFLHTTSLLEDDRMETLPGTDGSRRGDGSGTVPGRGLLIGAGPRFLDGPGKREYTTGRAHRRETAPGAAISPPNCG